MVSSMATETLAKSILHDPWNLRSILAKKARENYNSIQVLDCGAGIGRIAK